MTDNKVECGEHRLRRPAFVCQHLNTGIGKIFIILSLGWFVLLGCQNSKTSSNDHELKSDSLLIIEKSDPNDSTFTIFNDNNYTVSFKVIRLVDKNREAHKGTLTLFHKKDILLHDTLDFFMPQLELRDMNNDKVKDILILNSSSARSVWTFHLYLTDNKNRLLKRVKDFEEVYDPLLDTTNNIISSMARYSCVYYRFYRITGEDKLIDLGHDFEDCTLKENDKYSKAIKSILSEQ